MTIVGIHPEDLFDKLLDGEISPAERERLQAHLSSCEVCRFEYEARLDFQEEALEVGALMSAPPALPFRPLPLAETPTIAALPPRRRRSRRLIWGLAAAALITASGAVASGLSGKAPWHAVSLLFAHRSTPAEGTRSASTKPTTGRGVAPAAAVAASAPTPVAAASEPGAEALVVAEVVPAEHEARVHVAEKRRTVVAAAALRVAAASTNGDVASAKDESVKEPAAKEPASAAKLFGEANQARRSGDVGRASGLYHLLQDQFPGSPEAELSRVTLAMLLLDNGDAAGALSGFERYLAGSSRGLEAEALVGRARALGRLGRRAQEAAAWREVQSKYPRSIYGRQATERLLALGQP